MQFEKLVQNIIKENTSKTDEFVNSSEYGMRIINPTLITSLIKEDIEENWNQFKNKNQLVANITPEYEKRVLGLYKYFLGMFIPNFKNILKTNIYADFYKGKFVDAKFKVQHTQIEAIDLEVTKPIIDISGFVIYDFPYINMGSGETVPVSEGGKYEQHLVPIIQSWSCPNNINTNMDPWGDFSPEDININWIYSFLAGTFGTEPYFASRGIKRKKFNLDMIPEKAYDLLYKSSTERKSSWNEYRKELNEILDNLTTQQFEDTIKSQKVGKVLSRL